VVTLRPSFALHSVSSVLLDYVARLHIPVLFCFLNLLLQLPSLLILLFFPFVRILLFFCALHKFGKPHQFGLGFKIIFDFLSLGLKLLCFLTLLLLLHRYFFLFHFAVDLLAPAIHSRGLLCLRL
jgi:hypothetical protein